MFGGWSESKWVSWPAITHLSGSPHPPTAVCFQGRQAKLITGDGIEGLVLVSLVMSDPLIRIQFQHGLQELNTLFPKIHHSNLLQEIKHSITWRYAEGTLCVKMLILITPIILNVQSFSWVSVFFSYSSFFFNSQLTISQPLSMKSSPKTTSYWWPWRGRFVKL